MAWAEVVHSGVPGGANGLGADVRATLAGDGTFTTNWTVHPEVLFGAGTTERSYFVLEHSNGLQVLVYVANGSAASGSSGITSTWRNTSFTTTSDQQIWVAMDPDGGGAASGSFYDELNVNGTDPALIGFWNDGTEKTAAVRVVEWYDVALSSTLWFIFDTVNANLLIYSQGGEAVRDDTVSLVAMGEDFVDGASRPAADRLPRADGLLAVQGDTDSGGNDVVEYELYTFPGGAPEYRLYSAGTNVDTRWRLVDGGAAAEPDADGNYISQSIVVQNPADVINGVINFDMVRHIVSSAPVGQERKLGEWMTGPGELAGRWAGGGDINP